MQDINPDVIIAFEYSGSAFTPAAQEPLQSVSTPEGKYRAFSEQKFDTRFANKNRLRKKSCSPHKLRLRPCHHL
jgi:hypothetical protein